MQTLVLIFTRCKSSWSGFSIKSTTGDNVVKDYGKGCIDFLSFDSFGNVKFLSKMPT